MSAPHKPGSLTALHRETLAVRLAAERSAYGENSEALYLTSGYVQPSAEDSARRFAGEDDGYTYGRSGNPTVTSFEMRLAALEGAEACMATCGELAMARTMFTVFKRGILRRTAAALARTRLSGSVSRMMTKGYPCRLPVISTASTALARTRALA